MRSLPVLVGYVVLGTGFGILLRNAGYGVLWAAAMSLFIFGGSMQYVGVGLIAGGATIINTIVTTITVNARHLFYSISMINRYKGAGKYKPYMIFALTDETYSLLCDEVVPDDIDVNLYRFLVSMFNHMYWIAGGIIGNLLGAVLPFSADGVAFSMTALFVAAFTEQWLSAKDHLPAITGVVCTLVALLVFGKDNFLIPAMLLITAVLAVAGRKEVKES